MTESPDHNEPMLWGGPEWQKRWHGSQGGDSAGVPDDVVQPSEAPVMANGSELSPEDQTVTLTPEDEALLAQYREALAHEQDPRVGRDQYQDGTPVVAATSLEILTMMSPQAREFIKSRMRQQNIDQHIQG